MNEGKNHWKYRVYYRDRVHRYNYIYYNGYPTRKEADKVIKFFTKHGNPCKLEWDNKSEICTIYYPGES